jgi:hypothetical protein
MKVKAKKNEILIEKIFGNYLDDSSTSNIHTRESIKQEIDATFTAELACTAFVQFCRLCGE